ncbi:MAG TPA: VWA domain-containing protein [Vicinamibacterales bacterium]|nr:VWA domain-containing protein [Vicinamibacterales bacterium]
MTTRIIGWMLGIGLAVIARPAVVAQSGTPQIQPTFRAVTSLVPIDVRVLDRSGKPITDLKAADFTILEDGAPQKLGHFSVVTMTAATTPADAAPIRRQIPVENVLLAPQTRRLFLITLGRGRLQHPSRGIDAAIRFVGERLLPQDQVAVTAYNRATDFTTDRAQILQVLERFKAMHEMIEAKVRQHFSGFSAVYKSSDLPTEFQAEIDAIFKGTETRELPPGRITDASDLGRDDRRATDALQRAELLRERAEAAAAMGLPVSEFDKLAIAEAERFGSSLAEYVASNRQTMQDIGRLYAGIDYLRYIDGEKHLVFVTERGFLLPRVESDLSLAATANNARVAIDVIQTGGLAPTMKPSSPRDPLSLPIIDITRGEPLQQRFIVSSMKHIAELTGGQASVYEYADKAFDRVATSTSAGYLLGYYPTNPAFDDRYRRVTVKVNRSGATVLYRHGYFAERPRAPLDRRRALSYNRVATAVNYPQDIRDLDIQLKTSEVKGTGRVPDVVVDLTIDISKIGLTIADGRHRGGLDIAVFCQNADGDPVGDLWQKMDLNLSDATHLRMTRAGLSYSGRIPVTGIVKYVKVVVYDYASDRIGTVMRQVR